MTRPLLSLGLAIILSATACGGDKQARKPVATKVPAEPAAACPETPPLGELFAIWQMLSHHEFVISAADLRAASKDPVSALIYLSQHEDVIPSTRLRALEALSFVPDDRVKALYTKLLKPVEEGVDDNPRHKAIMGFARAFPDEALGVIGPVLAIEVDPQIRLTAAKALVEFCGEDGRIVVFQAADVESEKWVRDKMRNYATDRDNPMEPAPGKPKPTFH